MYAYLIRYIIHKFAFNKYTFRVGRPDFFCFSSVRMGRLTFSATLKYRAYKERNKRIRKISEVLNL